MQAEKKTRKVPHKPQPERFNEFLELSDGSGFELPTGEKFKYEKDGGWFAFFFSFC